MRQAAEKRFRENESRGVKNIESVKRQQKIKTEMEKMENFQSSEQGLKVILYFKLDNFLTLIFSSGKLVKLFLL